MLPEKGCTQESMEPGRNKKQRALFLKEDKAESLPVLIKISPFRYQQTPSENLK